MADMRGVRRSRRYRNSPSSWNGASIWSIVCAMDLGLLNETSLKKISLPTSNIANLKPEKKRRRSSTKNNLTSSASKITDASNDKSAANNKKIVDKVNATNQAKGKIKALKRRSCKSRRHGRKTSWKRGQSEQKITAEFSPDTAKQCRRNVILKGEKVQKPWENDERNNNDCNVTQLTLADAVYEKSNGNQLETESVDAIQALASFSEDALAGACTPGGGSLYNVHSKLAQSKTTDYGKIEESQHTEDYEIENESNYGKISGNFEYMECDLNRAMANISLNSGHGIHADLPMDNWFSSKSEVNLLLKEIANSETCLSNNTHFETARTSKSYASCDRLSWLEFNHSSPCRNGNDQSASSNPEMKFLSATCARRYFKLRHFSLAETEQMRLDTKSERRSSKIEESDDGYTTHSSSNSSVFRDPEKSTSPIIREFSEILYTNDSGVVENFLETSTGLSSIQRSPINNANSRKLLKDLVEEDLVTTMNCEPSMEEDPTVLFNSFKVACEIEIDIEIDESSEVNLTSLKSLSKDDASDQESSQSDFEQEESCCSNSISLQTNRTMLSKKICPVENPTTDDLSKKRSFDCAEEKIELISSSRSTRSVRLEKKESFENERLSFYLTRFKREREDKASVLKSVSSIYRHNRKVDFDELHKLPLAWRIPNDRNVLKPSENQLRGTVNRCRELFLSKNESGFCPVPNKRNAAERTSKSLDNGGGRSFISSQRRGSVRWECEKMKKEKQMLKKKKKKKKKMNTMVSRQDSIVEDSFKCEDKDERRRSDERKKHSEESDDEYRCSINIPGDCEENSDVRRRVTRGVTKTNQQNFIGKLVWGSCSGWWPALIIDADHVGMQTEPGKLWVYWIGEFRISLLKEKTQIDPFLKNLESRLAPNAKRNRAIDATMQLLRTRVNSNLTKPYNTWIKQNFSGLNESLDEIKFYPYPPKVQRLLDDFKEKNANVTKRYLKEKEKKREKMLKEKDKERLAISIKKIPNKSKASLYGTDLYEAHLPLKSQRPGVIVWAKISGHKWWPAMIIDYRDCCLREPMFGCQWIMWYGDHQISQVDHHSFLEFGKGFAKMVETVQRSKTHVYLLGVLQAARDYCLRLDCDSENWRFPDVYEYFAEHPVVDAAKALECKELNNGLSVYSKHIQEKLNHIKKMSNIDTDRQEVIQRSDDLRSVLNGEASVDTLCLRCLNSFDKRMDKHPFFHGGLCKLCSEQFKPYMFLYGKDGKCFHCTICAGSGVVLVCDKDDCPRVYCTACTKYLLCPKSYNRVLLEVPWECFLCKHQSPESISMTIRPRSDWKERFTSTFRTRSNSNLEKVETSGSLKKIRVLSLFDGLSTGLLVLLKLGFEIEVYYASEIDPDALMVSNTHFGDRVIHLGDVRQISKEKINEIAPIDLLIGGSPCNDLSLANPARRGLHDPEGTGILFFDYCRILKLMKKANKGRRLFWLFENVASMPTEYRLEMNRHLGQEPDVIDSANFSPQHRLRLYWHNFPMEAHSLSSYGEQDVQDILTPNCDRYSLVKKIRTVTTKVNSLKQGKLAMKPILMNDKSDSLWITELEEIFGFPRHYTDVKNLSATKRQRLIGKSWSVQTLTAIFRSLLPYFLCSTEPGN